MRTRIDIDGAYEHYCTENGHIKKGEFLQMIGDGLSWQNASNYNNTKTRKQVLEAAYDIKELTGLSLDKIIVRNEN